MNGITSALRHIFRHDGLLGGLHDHAAEVAKAPLRVCILRVLHFIANHLLLRLLGLVTISPCT